ncbi:lytic polysaccharide monooxygenase [Melanomma pulvis-pyrius CBS 109.77]|uniref:Lytic polysaccharide monooxygenase n=1 Tax=Melanomma pulvis-pyrius CBS 109.77 TaxID=1314802 RepID=A0A6A6XP71_9PLEO|nr:lytic polysaccharide monooxygenase [Melanomma pulvis-pyrius CBS 109.77]
MFVKSAIPLLLLPSLTSLTLGHSFLEKVWANGVEYAAWDPNAGSLGTPYPNNIPSWYTTNVGGNPLKPVKANTNDIICALNASPANISIPINAGSALTVKWWQAGIPFPTSHWGPIIDYIAACNGPCSKVDPSSLKFVKIAQRAWIDNSTYAEGFWATNQMIASNGTWAIEIPSGLKAGEYVVRHELIALHVAFEAIGKGPYYTDGAEFYPQCVSIKVGGFGTKKITGGVGAKSLYRGDEPGLAINIHTTPNHADYVSPGPAIWWGA